MNNTNKINVNFSSLVGLKAELLRKQAEVNNAKAKSESVRPTVKLKSKVKKKKQKNIPKPPEESIDIDDINAHRKSKLMLEAKMRLYDNLKKSRSNDHPHFLVDFASKSDESEADPSDHESTQLYSDDDEHWVEYTDCFGRTRKCLKEDLPRMKEKDKLLSDKVSEKSCDEEKIQEEPTCIKEPEIEIMRRRWEDQMEKLASKTDIHYQDVLFDEARAHGVGYYAFAQDEKERAKQQENLLKLRKDTEQKQKDVQEAKELRNKMEQNRLKAARIRQRIRAGLPPELTEEEIAEINARYNMSSKTTQENIEQLVNEREKDKKETLDAKEVSAENKIRAFGELLGKNNYWHEMSQEEWVEKRRKIRDEEFAPMYDNFQKSSTFNLNAMTDVQNEEIDYDIIGPLPPSMDTSQNSGTCAENVADFCSETGNSNTLNSDNILAGLKYLREKFEQKQ